MDKFQKSLLLNNLIILFALLNAFQHLYGDIRSMLDLTQLSNGTIKDVTYSYLSSITVYTDRDTFHIYIFYPLIVAFYGILSNLLCLLINYRKSK